MRRRTSLLLLTACGAVVLSCGTALALNAIQCKTNQTCRGTDGRDLMKGTGGPNDMFARGGGDTLKGFGGEDSLLGQKGNDRLLGGDLDDSLYPGTGNDASNGGAGADLYSFGPGNWGRDTVEDPDAVNRLHLDDIGAAVTVSLTSGPLGPEMTSGKSTVNWSGSVVRDLVTYVTYNSSGTSNSDNQFDLIVHC